MASSRDAETCFASPLELGVGLIDITRTGARSRCGLGGAYKRGDAPLRPKIYGHISSRVSGVKVEESLCRNGVRARGRA